MPTISIQCDNCFYEEESTSYDVQCWAMSCVWCGNDCCLDCKDDENTTFHSNCYKEYQEEIKEQE